MNRIILIAFAIPLLIVGCKTNTNNPKGLLDDSIKFNWLDDSVAFKKLIANNFGFKLIDQDESEGIWHLWRNNDGMTYCDTIGFGPCNEKAVVRDAQGRIIVVAGRASECSFYNALKYIYSEDGDLTGFVTLGGTADFGFSEPPEYRYSYSIMEARYYEWPNECYNDNDYFNNYKIPSTISPEVIELALTTNYDAPYYLRFFFDKNEDGQIVRVYDPKYHLRYDAPYNGYIEYMVKEYIFGCSDIDCDNIKLLFLTRPQDPKYKHFEYDTIIWYSDYSEYREQEFPVI